MRHATGECGVGFVGQKLIEELEETVVRLKVDAVLV